MRWCCGDPKVGCFKDIVDAFLEAICEEVKEVMYGMLLQPRRGFEVERGSLGASGANHSKWMVTSNRVWCAEKMQNRREEHFWIVLFGSGGRTNQNRNKIAMRG